ncbi:hypothetical protein DLAC_03639 [Tieghemostelium lacteum]|uniref:Clu domain-containing protein n=1 Tax=Tieghemostelium lacteum TaxID=361077 RepID=A0A152A0G2_TIELA|nr:hypothetical protein DLAC_03639 [Tieghemostelium lacteum]|eukprot:KYQ99699.1 hypothetical protein DLAC_03639 [Tieghemostelium lacteum]
MDPYGVGYTSQEVDPYHPSGSEKSTSSGSSGSSSYNPNAVVYSSNSESERKLNNIYSLEHDGNVHFTTQEEQEEAWSDLFVRGLKNIEDTDLSREITHWNELFQKILDLEESDERSKKLATIANDFVYCADTFGKIIISELHSPLEQKTIKPVNIGGVAGGLKFKIQDIIFKFVIDTEIREGVWMYGDNKRADGFAQKSANHEIKGLNHFMEISNGGLIRFPLMAIIDYRGYRLLAISQLPIDKTTIVYGSCDAGKTVHNSDPLISQEMERISKILNLRGHTVGLTQTFIYGPGDIEVHKGTDGRYYMIDFARIFPPEYPLVYQNQKDTIGREIFYQMLRPELVAKCDTPLSSDAFSGWQTSLFEEGLNRDVVRATNILHNEMIPTIIHNINMKPETDYSPSRHKVFEIMKILNIFHSMGINNRYIGSLASQITNKSIRELLLSEVVGRVWKRIIRSKLRRIMDITRRPSEEPYKVLIDEVFAMILKQEPEQIEFWSSMEKGSFKHIALQVYPRCLSQSDMNAEYDLRQCIDVKVVILRLRKFLNININESSLNQFLESNDYVLGIQDIVDVGSTVKYSCIVDYSHGSQLLTHTKDILRSSSTPNPLEVDRWISNTGEILNEAIRQMPRSFKVLLKLLQASHVKVSITNDHMKATRILIVGVVMHQMSVSNEMRSHPDIASLIGLIHLQLATIYLFHSDLDREFKEELVDAKKLLEVALEKDPNCLDEYILETLPLFTSQHSVVPVRHESYQKRKVHNLLTLVYMLNSSPSLQKPIQKYLNQIKQIDNFEILPHAESLFDCKQISKFFQNFQNQLESLSIQKLTISSLVRESLAKLSNLRILSVSDISPPSHKPEDTDPSLHLFFSSIFQGCPLISSLSITSNKLVNDHTFEGLHHHFSRLKYLELSKLPLLTDVTLTNIAPHLTNLQSLSLNNSKEYTDTAMTLLLRTISKTLETLHVDHLTLITDQICQVIIDCHPNISDLTLTNCIGFTTNATENIANKLSNLKIYDRVKISTPHTYKIFNLRTLETISIEQFNTTAFE